ncbi:hypothetical protein FRB96_007578 [Tulasnella sp. 330]|nr:hypothetical protein FRB96_007578 [Tulasnella sp. 330]
MASLRFLAENAHRPPTTLQGWYFYNKTKNYRVLLAGFKGAGRESLRLGAMGCSWVALEEGCQSLAFTIHAPWLALGKEVVAGTGTAALVAGISESRSNPFDALPPRAAATTSSSVAAGHPKQPSYSPTGLARSHVPQPLHTSSTKTELKEAHSSPSSGARTPTTPGGSHHHHHLLNLSHHQSHDLPRASSSLAVSTLPTTQISLNPPEFMMKPPPLSRNATAKALPTQATLAVNAASDSVEDTATAVEEVQDANNRGQSRGQIHIKVIQARGLRVASSSSKPYVVVQFENNEFISRDPISDKEKEVRGVPQPLSRNNSSNALSSLGILKASDAAARGRQNSGPHLGVGGNLITGHLPFGAVIQPNNPVWKHEVTFDVISNQSHLTFEVYDRNVTESGFLGFIETKPVLVHEHTVDQWLKLKPRDNETIGGEIRIQVTYEQFKTARRLGPRDFEFLKLIGRGTFGRVFQVRKKDTRRIYAMKILSKKEIIAKKEVAHTIGERKILQTSLESPFLVGLKFSFQTASELFLVTDFKSGGELFWHLQKETRFTEERARFYIAELVLALEHLHKYDIVYRDLKPENILLDATGHVALCDFGLSKPDLKSNELTNTFCGTTEYLAPEVLLDDSGYSKLVDFWSLGVLLFEMCCGWSPFYAEDTQTMYRNICFGKIRFPKGVIGEDGKQFVKGLLNRNAQHRLGALRDAEELKEHPFFATIDWKALALKQVTPPFKPSVDSDDSTANFDPEFTEADLKEQGIDFDDEDSDASPVNDAFSQLTMGNTTANGSDASSVKTSPTSGHSEKPGSVKSKSGVEINAKGDKGSGANSSPITSSVQENFRGFTYTGESVMGQAMGLLGKEDPWNEGDEEPDLDGFTHAAYDDGDDDWEDADDAPQHMKSKTRAAEASGVLID